MTKPEARWHNILEWCFYLAFGVSLLVQSPILFANGEAVKGAWALIYGIAFTVVGVMIRRLYERIR